MMIIMSTENKNTQERKNNNTVEALTLRLTSAQELLQKQLTKQANLEMSINQQRNRIANLARQIEILKKSQQ